MFIVSRLISVDVIGRFMSQIVETKAENFWETIYCKIPPDSKKI